jgi:stage III sporulation protein SpoIIIAA
MQRLITDDLDALFATLPPHICDPLSAADDLGDLLEIVLDLGREPEARFFGRDMVLSNRVVTHEDIDYLTARIGAFGDDNRAGIERTLHRISAMRNRTGRVIGLTCRVGRSVYGTIKVIEDIVESGRSFLLLGRPGVGKTTMLREVARVLADDFRKRVVIVDTSNEIAGDGDIPHPAIGRSRRMQVPSPSQQHAVMIEAVENHMPEVIVIDEIGTELEAAAARTIAERGVQLVGTAHGQTLDNLMLNPTLSDLVGGIQSVTLGDEEARRRGTQKTILERKAPPTFDVVVEIQTWTRVAVHHDVAETIDGMLRGRPMPAELRWVDETGELHKTVETPARPAAVPNRDEDVGYGYEPPPQTGAARVGPPEANKVVRVFPFGISLARLREAVEEIGLPVVVAEHLDDTDVFLTLRNYYKRKPPVLREAESRGIPVYVLKSNNEMQIQQVLAGLFETDDWDDPTSAALQEAEAAVADVLATNTAVELTPQNAYVRRLQHLLAERYNLASTSKGREPYRRVKIYQERQPSE